MSFQCDKCNKVFTVNGHLKRHIKSIHDKIKNIKCDKCEYLCSTNECLKRHTKTVHDKIKDMKCDKCDYICSTNGHLKRHIKMVHDKIKDFKCDKCEYTCSENITLKQHIKIVHNKIKEFKCHKCDYMCSTNSDLKRHIKHVHDKIKDYQCDKCNYRCENKSILKTHLKNVHERPKMDKRMSLNEAVIFNYLTKNNIVFEQEKKYNLRSPKGSLLRYDFYIPSLNTLLEFDGKQHFKPVSWNSLDTEEQVKEKFEYLQLCDKLKNEYATNNNIKLVRIKYNEDVEQRLSELLNIA
jgi:KRAB domain-containing zinc finger protein